MSSVRLNIELQRQWLKATQLVFACYFAFFRSFSMDSFVRCLVLPSDRPFLRSFVRSFICSFVRRSFVRLFVCSFVRSFVRLFVLSFVRSFVRSFFPGGAGSAL